MDFIALADVDQHNFLAYFSQELRRHFDGIEPGDNGIKTMNLEDNYAFYKQFEPLFNRVNNLNINAQPEEFELWQRGNRVYNLTQADVFLLVDCVISDYLNLRDERLEMAGPVARVAPIILKSTLPLTPVKTYSQHPENARDTIYNTDLGIDIVNAPSTIISVEDYLAENEGDEVVIMRFIGDNVEGDAVSSRTIMITKDYLKHFISNTIIYPCIEANRLIGDVFVGDVLVSSNVIRDRPLYNLSMLETMGAVEKSNLDDLLEIDGNLFLLFRYAHETFVTLASESILNNQNFDEKGQVTWEGGLHCADGAEPVKLFFAVLINYNASGIHKKVRKSKKRRKRVSIVKKQKQKSKKQKQKSKKQKSKN